MQNTIEELYEALTKQDLVLQELAKQQIQGMHVEIADLQAAQRVFIKYFILAVASFFEAKIKDSIRDFVSQVSQGNQTVLKIVNSKFLDRGYHTIVAWHKKPNIEHFCNFFGVNYDQYKLLYDKDMSPCFADFHYFGDQRNQLIHNNINAQNIEDTLPSAFKRYESAMKFIDSIPKMLELTRNNPEQ